MCDRSHIAKQLRRAISQVYDLDRTLIDIKVHERTIAARLAMYLVDLFPEWDVDCEYNRDRRKPKMILDRCAYPDVIIHRRNTGTNLLAVEMKGYWSEDDREHDYRKLAFLTGPDFEYELGVHIELGPDAFGLRWFADGVSAEVAE